MITKPVNIKTKSLKLIYNPMFRNARNGQFLKAQKVIDSEVIRLTAPFVPFDKGPLSQSAIVHTVIGSGEVKYVTPYASRLYYSKGYTFQGAPLRGAFWFERMKPGNKEYIRKKAGAKLR